MSFKFPTAMNVHLSVWEGLVKPSVWVFPEVFVCLNCGLAEFDVPVRKLAELMDGKQYKSQGALVVNCVLRSKPGFPDPTIPVRFRAAYYIVTPSEGFNTSL